MNYRLWMVLRCALRVSIGMSIIFLNHCAKIAGEIRMKKTTKLIELAWICDTHRKFESNRWSTLHSQFQTKDLSIGLSIHFCARSKTKPTSKWKTENKTKNTTNIFSVVNAVILCCNLSVILIFVRSGQNKKQRTMKSKKKYIRKTRIVQCDEHGIRQYTNSNNNKTTEGERARSAKRTNIQHTILMHES